MNGRTNDTLKDLLPACALVALGDEDTRFVAAHLGDYSERQRELAELQDTVMALAFGVPMAMPPGAAKAALFTRVDALLPGRDAAPTVAPRPLPATPPAIARVP